MTLAEAFKRKIGRLKS